jgi:hypothetical protein
MLATFFPKHKIQASVSLSKKLDVIITVAYPIRVRQSPLSPLLERGGDTHCVFSTAPEPRYYSYTSNKAVLENEQNVFTE